MSEEIKFDLNITTDKFNRSLTAATNTAKRLDKSVDDLRKSIKSADNETIDIKADTSGIDKAEAKIKALDGASANVDVKTDVDDSSVTDLLARLAAPVIITATVVTAGGAIVNEAASDRAAVGAFALATGQTREAAAEIGTEISEVWASGLAESKTQIAGVAAQLYQAGVDLQDIGAVASDAFTIAAATGEDVNDIIAAQVTLVRTGLAPSYQEASDLLAGGFAGGLNRANDLLDTIKEYSRDFADLGLTGKTFFDILNSGLEGGAYNTDKIADAFRELKIRVATALSAEGTERQGLMALGLFDEAQAFQAGEITGEEFVRGVLATVSVENLDAVVTGTFGSPIEDLGVTVFEAIDAALGNPALIDTWSGTTDNMRDVLTDNLDVAFKRAYNAVVTDLTRGFIIAGQPLTDLLDALPDRLNEFADHVQSGAGIPEALEFTLDAPGLATDIRQLQATIGGFIIEFQLAIAGFLEAIGQGDAAGGLRTSAAASAQAQLAFDIQYLDPENTANSIATALRRGVELSEIEAAIAEAGENLIADDKLKKFQEILDQLEDTAFLPTRIGHSYMWEDMLLPTAPEDSESLQERVSAAAFNQGLLATTRATFGELITFDTEAILESAGHVETLGKRTAESDDALVSYGQSFDGWGDRVVSGTDRAAAGVEAFGDITLSTLEKINQAAMITQQHLFDAGIDPTRFAAMTFGHTVDPANVNGSHAAGLSYVPFDGYTATLHQGEAVLPAQEAAAYRALSGGGMTITNNHEFNILQNLNAGSMSQASAAGARFANQIRGFS